MQKTAVKDNERLCQLLCSQPIVLSNQYNCLSSLFFKQLVKAIKVEALLFKHSIQAKKVEKHHHKIDKQLQLNYQAV